MLHEKTAFPALSHIRSLDGLRGAALLLVVTGHIVRFSCGIVGNWEAFGGMGVTLFFVLSGFLITALLCKEEGQHGTVDLFAFYKNRALRIFPAYYAMLAVVAILVKARLITDISWATMAVCVFYMRNIFGRGEALAHTWSLSLEQQFYVLWPLALKRIGTRLLLPISMGLVLVITLWRTAAILLELWRYQDGWFYVRPDFRFDSILIGCCIALILYAPSALATAIQPLAHRLGKLAHPAWVFPSLALWSYFSFDKPALHPFIITVQIILSGLLLLNLVLNPASMLSHFFSQAWIRTVGRFSYSIYLWQQIFLVEKNPSWGLVRVFPFDLAAACLAGVASYYLVELPFLKWKARLRRPVPVSQTNVAIAG